MTDNPYQRPEASDPAARTAKGRLGHVGWLIASLLVYWFGGPAVCFAALGSRREGQQAAVVAWVLIQLFAFVANILALRAFLERPRPHGAGGCLFLALWLGHAAAVTVLGLMQLSAL